MAELLALKAVRAWYGTYSGRGEFRLIFINGAYLSLLGLAISRSLRAERARRRYTMLAIALVIYSWAMTMVGMSLVRYMVPSIITLFPLAGTLRRSHSAPRPAMPGILEDHDQFGPDVSNVTRWASHAQAPVRP